MIIFSIGLHSWKKTRKTIRAAYLLCRSKKMEIIMNSSTRITLILLLTSLTTLIHGSHKSAKEMIQHHEEKATMHAGFTQAAFTSLFTTGSFELLYRDLDKNGHVPPNWIFWRRLNKPLLAVTAAAFVGASGAWFYNVACTQHYKEESKKYQEESKKWFWQK
jgi:hypothetical protein